MKICSRVNDNYFIKIKSLKQGAYVAFEEFELLKYRATLSILTGRDGDLLFALLVFNDRLR